MNLLEFKEKLGKPLSDINIQDIRNMMADNDMMMALNDYETGLAISEEVIHTNQDSEVKSEFAPLAYHHEFYGAQEALFKMFTQYDSDNDAAKLAASMDSFLKGATPLGKLSGYMLALTKLDGYEIQLEDIQKAVDDSIQIMFSLEFEKGFPVICDILDMLYTIQEEYYKQYQYDLIADKADELNSFIEKLNEFTQPIYDRMEETIESSLPDDTTPEDIGMLDMTKFKENPNEKEERN